MIGILHKNKTADSMSESLNNFQDKLSDKEYNRLFSLLLTDRGTEFAKPQQFEININTGEITLELAEIKRRWEPYINQLPDYASIM